MYQNYWRALEADLQELLFAILSLLHSLHSWPWHTRQHLLCQTMIHGDPLCIAKLLENKSLVKIMIFDPDCCHLYFATQYFYRQKIHRSFPTCLCRTKSIRTFCKLSTPAIVLVSKYSHLNVLPSDLLLFIDSSHSFFSLWFGLLVQDFNKNTDWWLIIKRVVARMVRVNFELMQTRWLIYIC